ncbi:MAG: carboxypeptidase-like regulatory domain-containing protein, partial [Gammaproteobacteria bacterium]|nr:carboxypeptidase-like regulatory domain-containing protein [Gammaproteobacteria bacterium]
SAMLFSLTTEVSMGLFDFMRVCLFSEVNGVVTVQGKPVAGARIVRTAKLGDKPYTDTTTTDSRGMFNFKARFTNSVNKIAPVEPRIPQKLVIEHAGKEHVGWEMSKHNYDTDGELGKPINISCELTNEETKQEIGYKIIWGKCKVN